MRRSSTTSTGGRVVHSSVPPPVRDDYISNVSGNSDYWIAKSLEYAGQVQAEADPGVGDAVHTVLDVAGMIPLLGAVPDLINAGIYAAEGDYGMAALSAGAAIPLVGDLAGAGKLAVKYGDDVIGLASHAGDEIAEAGAKGIDILSGAGAKKVDDLPIGAACSFDGGTVVQTTEGEVPIGEVDVGDEVIASDEATGATAAYPVSAVWSHDDQITGTVEIDGEPIAVTPDHPFRTVERGWLAAGELRPGDQVVSLEGAPGTVTAISWDGGPAEMWNLTVAVAHTYTVGSGGWLVHNDCITDFASRADARAASSGAEADFFRSSTGKSTNFRRVHEADGTVRSEYFSPADNPGYGKRYVLNTDSTGAPIGRSRQTIQQGPGGSGDFIMILKDTEY